MKVSNTYSRFPFIEINSVRKSGTHLLEKIFSLLEINKGYRRRVLHMTHKLSKGINGAPYGHPESKYDPKKKYCVLYRDPRDLVISLIFYHKMFNFYNINDYEMDTLLDIYLNSEKIPWGSKKIGVDAKRLYTDLQIALFVKKHPKPNRLLVRFEDIIPSFAGGSSEEKRFKTLRKICSFSKRPVTDVKIKAVMAESWGGTKTFRDEEKKKVGQWVKYFKPRHIELFHKKYNHFVMGLGYETDPNWHLKYLNLESQNQAALAS